MSYEDHLAPDKTRARTYIYHKDQKPRMVYSEDAPKYYADGWQDTPAAFFNMDAHGVPEDKKTELHKEMKDIKDMVNDEINLDAMDAKSLKAYADKYLPGLVYKKNAGQQKMLNLIKEAKANVEAEEDKFLSDEETVG